MRIGITVWGTDGDVLPVVGLAKRLAAKGHRPVVCGPDAYRRKIEKRGIDYRAVGSPWQLSRFKALLDRASDIDPVRFAVRVSKEGILAGGEAWYRDVREVLESCDVALCPAQDIPGQEAALSLGVPLATYFLTPAWLPTAHDAPAPLPSMGSLGNRLAWWGMDQVLRRAIDPLYNDFVQSVGGTPRRSYSLRSMYSRELNLIPFSSVLWSRPEDLPEHHRMTAPWPVSTDEDAPLPPELEEFLAAGPAPIVVTLGSMGGEQGERLSGIVLGALRATGHRAVVQAGWAGLDDGAGTSDRILRVGWAPHATLFRHARVVVHHGGAGTTHAVCRAGAPSVVVTFLHDQPFNARSLHRLGVAPRPVSHKRLSASRLRRRVEEVLSSPSMTHRARELADRMAGEDGRDEAIFHLEQLASRDANFIQRRA